MRAWFVALAATVWAIVVAAAFLLFVSIGFCLRSDPYFTNNFLCSTVGTTGYLDIITLVVGIPVLILIDHKARNPFLVEKPVTTRIMYLWMTFTTIVFLLFLSFLLPAGLLSFLLALWLGAGLTWATLLFIRTKTRRSR